MNAARTLKKLIQPSHVQLTLHTSLTGVVAAMTYARNHHWLKLKDHKGREVMLVEHGVVRYQCDGCDFAFVTETSLGPTCTCVRCAATMKAQWMKPQVALIPQQESDFEMPHKHNADKRADEALDDDGQSSV